MRSARTDHPGAFHHVFARGNNKQAIFRDDDDRLFFLARLRQLKRELAFKLHALVLMTNHFHVLPQTGPVPLSRLMSRLLTPYSMRFNRKYGTVGHLFQDRYGAKPCRADAYFLRLIRYIHRNPVAAGLAARPEDWRWSGHHELIGASTGLIDPELALSVLGADERGARAAYSAYVSDECDDGWQPSNETDTAIEDGGASLSEIVGSVAASFGLSSEAVALGDRTRIATRARIEVVALAWKAGFPQASIARALGCSPGAVSHLRRKLNDSGPSPVV
jgi:REP element-mobilizing transposase RayT